MRRNPKIYAEEINKAKALIEVKDGKIIVKKGKLSCKLLKGEEAFDNIIEKLKNMSPIGPLSFQQHLVIDLTNYSDSKAVIQALDRKKKELKERGMVVNSFHDKISDPYFGVMMQVIDDNNQFNGKRSEILLKSDMNYIGISYRNLVEKLGDKQVNTFIACFLLAK